MYSLYAFFICVCLCSCGASPRGIIPVTEFTADFAGSFNGVPVGGTVSSRPPNLLDISFTSPDSMENFSARIKGSTLTLKRGELVCTADEAYLPCGSLPSLLRGCLKEAANAQASPDGVISVSYGGSTYTLTTDPDGRLLTIDGGSVHLAFSA